MSSLAETDLDAAITASHAMTFGDTVTTSFGMEDVDGADGVLSNEASGISLPSFSPLFLLSLSSFLFGYVRPWRIVACCFLHVWYVSHLVHPLVECPGSIQWKHSWQDTNFGHACRR